jgi:serine/threonine-protein kinase
MELLDGESLGARLKRERRVSAQDAVKFVRHALMSLGEAHDKGVIHRDLKPDNLILLRDATGEEMCKVLDFGIAKVLTHQEGVDALETQAGTVFGTPRYMSPEQAQGKQLDARSDLYSLGVILYHMLLGKPPYTDSDAVVVMAHHIKTIPKRPTAADPDLDIPQDLEALLLRVLDKDPEKRPQSASAFVAELDGLGPLTTTNASAQMAAVVDTRGPSRSRRVMVIGAATAAAVGLIAAVAVTRVTSDSTSAREGVTPTQDAKTGIATAASVIGVEVRQSVAPTSTATASAPEASASASASAAPDADSAPPSSVRPIAPDRQKPKPSAPRSYEKFD